MLERLACPTGALDGPHAERVASAFSRTNLFDRFPAAVIAPRRHWPSAAGFRGPENRRGSYSRFARRLGEYGCAWATDVRRTDAPVVSWDLRGSHRPNSPRGIAAPVFLLRCASLQSSRSLTPPVRGPLQTAAAAQHRHGTGGQRKGCRSRRRAAALGSWCLLRQAVRKLVNQLQQHLRELQQFIRIGLGHDDNLVVCFIALRSDVIYPWPCVRRHVVVIGQVVDIRHERLPWRSKDNCSNVGVSCRRPLADARCETV